MIDLTQAHELDAFKKLVSARARVIWPLSIVLVIALAGNLYLMSAGADLGSKPAFENSVVTIALAYSVGLIFISALTAIFYVWWANKYLDPIMEQVNREIVQAEKDA